jgi:hypothetical protein
VTIADSTAGTSSTSWKITSPATISVAWPTNTANRSGTASTGLPADQLPHPGDLGQSQATTGEQLAVGVQQHDRGRQHEPDQGPGRGVGTRLPERCEPASPAAARTPLSTPAALVSTTMVAAGHHRTPGEPLGRVSPGKRSACSGQGSS